jgi:asparagine synthase (glutamine-hydrolysing)
MGLFFLIRGRPDASRNAIAAERICAKMGFAAPKIFSADGVMVYVYPKRSQTHTNTVTFANGDFAVACGTFIFRGEIGEAALKAFYNVFDGDFSQLDEAVCGFVIIIRKAGRVHVAGDRSGGYHLFRNAMATMVSSSFLVAATALDRVTVTAQSIFEYVFNGVVSGNETLIAEISLLPIGSSLAIDGENVTLLQRPTLEPPSAPFLLPRDELIKRSFAELDRQFGIFTKLFSDSVTCALSGGYDSRLILAMLRRRGCRPRVYVYGRPTDRDIAIASRIARGEGFALDVIDKESRIVVDPAEFSEIVARSYLAADGYCWDGLFNNGAEQEQRATRGAGGAIVLNGGGGEIFRNFFYLRDRPYSVRQLLWSFYAQFDPYACTESFKGERYFCDLERKILELIGPVKWLERPTIDWLYHRFRCRSWDGRVDTINSQYSFTGLPFLNARITDLASQIPVRWKNHGAFEAELIRLADARLASYSSIYGYNFLSYPPFGARMRDFTSYFRPPTLRRFVHRVKHRWRRGSLWRGYLASTYVNAVLPDGVQAMRSFFRLDRVGDPAQMARILSLEYLVRQFGHQLRFDLY